MRAEKIVGYIGLGLFGLFPLVSLFQLRDTDDAWRQAARRARPSVLTLHRVSGEPSSTGPMACGVVLAQRPLRVVVVGRTASVHLASRAGDTWVAWETAYEDPEGEYSILQAKENPRVLPIGMVASSEEHADISGSALLAPAPFATERAGKELHEGVAVALVGPRELAPSPIWVGVLTPASVGKLEYRAGGLRAVHDPVSPAPGVGPSESVEIDPVLTGAPFVDRQGSVVALYIGDRARGPAALSIEVVREALQVMERHASR